MAVMVQSEISGIGATQVLGMALGAGLVGALFVMLAWLNRRARSARVERPPQKQRLLRPPGHWLQCQVEELSEKWSDAVMQAVAAGTLIGLLGSAIYPIIEGVLLHRFTFAQIWTHPKSCFLLSIAALTISAVAWIIKAMVQAVRLHRKIRNCRFGLRGEQAVAQALADRAIAAAGYVVFHDVPGDGAWNIDHVVVGPGGIFVLETKTRSRRKPLWDQPDQKVYYNGQRLRFPWCEDRKAVGQVKLNTQWVRQLLSGFTPKDIAIQPVIVVPGWFVETQGTYPVHAMNADYLIIYIAKSKPRYTNEELQGVVHRLDERCRDVEF